MGIYRGAGGSGDAVNDSSSEALITLQARDQAIAAKVAAEAAQAAAQLAETNAETAETNAETAETNAETAATNAANSASSASTSASNAASSASSASTSASNASTSASNAASSASSASTSASNAAASASTATTQATNASNSASSAATSATNASNSASAAATSATNAANSATAAQTARTAAELAETNAETAEANAELAETNAETAASNAAASESAAATSASNASSSASSAASSASAASTSATNAANSASAASTSATNAANSASAALTSENNAASSASAASASASNAASSATSASGSASTATTQATNAANSASAAATSATNAANSASAASTSASNAATSESNAATSASNAASSASSASTSASNASTSASNAASSASAAAASYDSFDDRYLGAKSSAPTLDNDGNTLLVGALYFNTNTNEMKVWDGSTWLNAYASLSGALLATNNLSDLNNTATARTNLGVAIGVNVQAWDADLDTWATKTAPSGTVVGTSDSQTLTNKTLTTPVISTISNTGTLTLPTSTDTLVGRATSDTLTNKTIALGSNTISGTLAQFNTAVTDADLVSIAGTETLTNKTLTSPAINSATISGGTINNAAIGGTTPAAGSFTSLTDSGNLTFTGTGNRITGDFSNATIANRVGFQSSTTNGNTDIQVIPNGTAVISGIRLNNNSDPTNAGYVRLSLSSTEASLSVDRNSVSGTYIPLGFNTGGSERVRIDTSGNVGIGTSSPSFPLDVNGVIRGRAAGGEGGQIDLNNPDNNSIGLTVDVGSADNGRIFSTRNNCTLQFGQLGGTGGVVTLHTAATERMRITAAGDALIGTTTADNKLTVSSSSNAAATGVIALVNPNDGTNTAADLEFVTHSSGTLATGRIRGLVAGANDYPMSFWTYNSGGIGERLRIGASGQIGIGGANYGNSGQVLTSNGASAAPSWQDSSGFPAGTAMLFAQTSAPTGWTKSTTHDNKALRVVSGTAGSGGSVAFTTAFASGLSANATTLSTTQIPSHTHGSTFNIFWAAGNRFAGGDAWGYDFSRTTSATGGGGSHTHTLPSFAVQYVDVIIATKN